MVVHVYTGYGSRTPVDAHNNEVLRTLVENPSILFPGTVPPPTTAAAEPQYVTATAGIAPDDVTMAVPDAASAATTPSIKRPRSRVPSNTCRGFTKNPGVSKKTKVNTNEPTVDDQQREYNEYKLSGEFRKWATWVIKKNRRRPRVYPAKKKPAAMQKKPAVPKNKNKKKLRWRQRP